MGGNAAEALSDGDFGVSCARAVSRANHGKGANKWGHFMGADFRPPASRRKSVFQSLFEFCLIPRHGERTT